MKNLRWPVLLVLAFFSLNNVFADVYYNYHCGYKEDANGDYHNLWSTGLIGPNRYLLEGESQSHGSIIFDNKVAICMMTQWNDNPGDSLNLFISFYEGELLNYAPGICSFLGATTYLPYGEQITSEGHVVAQHFSLLSNHNFLVSHRVITDPADFKDDKCKSDLEDYL